MDTNEIYKKKWLNLNEVSYLLGGLTKNNVYLKFKNGQIPYVKRKNERGDNVIRVRSKDMFEYIVRKRLEMARYMNGLKLPSEDINWDKQED